MKNKNFKKSQLVILFICLIQNLLLACNCPYEPIFCEAITQSDNVIRAIVKDHPNHYSMTVEVIDNLNQEIAEDSITVVGHDGINCGQALGIFEINDTIILALNELVIDGISYWYLDGCGLHYLKYENGNVYGQITDEISSLPFDFFRNNIFQCFVGVLVSSEDMDSQNDFEISPNPTTDILQIRNSKDLIEEIEIFNSNGTLIFKESKIARAIKINTQPFEKGVYFIKIHTLKGILTRKFLKI